MLFPSKKTNSLTQSRQDAKGLSVGVWGWLRREQRDLRVWEMVLKEKGNYFYMGYF